MQFIEFEFKKSDGTWAKACLESEKADIMMTKLSSMTEVRQLS